MLPPDSIGPSTETHHAARYRKAPPVAEDASAFAKTIENIKSSSGKIWTDGDLYGPNGPKSEDIEQDSLGDCYFVADLGAFANQQPDLIKKAITYDPKTTNFTVTLYKDQRDLLHPLGGVKQVTITVTQKDIRDNIDRGGGSTVDNHSNESGPLWPAVIEAARAKMLDSNPGNGLDEGYNDLEHQGPFGLSGGTPEGAMLTISGSRGHSLQAASWLASIQDKLPHQFKTILPLPFGPKVPHGLASEYVYREVRSALDQGRPVVFGTGLFDDPRGIASKHAYIVEGINKDGSGDIQVTLRNPWHENSVGSLNRDPDNPVITVKLGELVPLATMGGFIIGPGRK